MPIYSVRYDGTELSRHAGITDAIHEWAIRRAATVGLMVGPACLARMVDGDTIEDEDWTPETDEEVDL